MERQNSGGKKRKWWKSDQYEVHNSEDVNLQGLKEAVSLRGGQERDRSAKEAEEKQLISKTRSGTGSVEQRMSGQGNSSRRGTVSIQRSQGRREVAVKGNKLRTREKKRDGCSSPSDNRKSLGFGLLGRQR